jgi:hypothetical protein
LCVIPSRVPLSFFEGAERRPYRSGWYSAVGRLLTTPHSVAQWLGWPRHGSWRSSAGHDSQARSGVDSPLTWTRVGVSALNAPVGGAGTGAAARDPLERDGNSLEGAFGSRSRRGLARGGASSPQARRNPARGSSDLEPDGSSLEVVTGPRARWIFSEAAPYPSSGAEFRPRVAGPIV